MVPIARRNLLAEKGRFLISVGGVAFAVLLILVILGLYRSISRTGATYRQLPGDIWVAQEGTSEPMHSSSLLAPDTIASLEQVPGAAVVVPVLLRQMSFEYGRREEASARFLAVSVPPDSRVRGLFSEQFLPGRGQITIDKTLSRKTGLKEGDSVVVGGQAMTVSAVRPSSGEMILQFAFLHFEDAQRLFGAGNLVNYGMVILAPGLDAGEMAARFERSVPGVTAFTENEFTQAIRKEIDEAFVPIVGVLVTVGFLVGAAVVGLTIYTATIERTREYGVMKAVGGTGAFLYRIVLSQSAMLTTVGYVFGVAGALLVAQLAERAVPEFGTEFEAGDLAAVFVAATFMSVVASLAPVQRINGIDPAIVFRA